MRRFTLAALVFLRHEVIVPRVVQVLLGVRHARACRGEEMPTWPLP